MEHLCYRVQELGLYTFKNGPFSGSPCILELLWTCSAQKCFALPMVSESHSTIRRKIVVLFNTRVVTDVLFLWMPCLWCRIDVYQSYARWQRHSTLVYGCLDAVVTVLPAHQIRWAKQVLFPRASVFVSVCQSVCAQNSKKLYWSEIDITLECV